MMMVVVVVAIVVMEKWNTTLLLTTKQEVMQSKPIKILQLDSLSLTLLYSTYLINTRTKQS